MFDLTVSSSIRLLDSVFVALDAARVEQERRELLHGGLPRLLLGPSLVPARGNFALQLALADHGANCGEPTYCCYCGSRTRSP